MGVLRGTAEWVWREGLKNGCGERDCRMGAGRGTEEWVQGEGLKNGCGERD